MVSRGAVGDLLTITFHVPAEPAHSHGRAACFVNTQMLLLLLMRIWIFMSLKGSIQRLIHYFLPLLPLQSSPMKAPNVAKKKSLPWKHGLKLRERDVLFPYTACAFILKSWNWSCRYRRKLLSRQTSGNTTDGVDGTVQQGSRALWQQHLAPNSCEADTRGCKGQKRRAARLYLKRIGSWCELLKAGLCFCVASTVQTPTGTWCAPPKYPDYASRQRVVTWTSRTVIGSFRKSLRIQSLSCKSE